MSYRWSILHSSLGDTNIPEARGEINQSLVGICKPNDPVLRVNMTLCLSPEEICGYHQTLIKVRNTLFLLGSAFGKRMKYFCAEGISGQ